MDDHDSNSNNSVPDQLNNKYENGFCRMVWCISGPCILSSIFQFSLAFITQTWVGHVCTLQLAAFGLQNFFSAVGYGKCIRNIMRTSMWSRKTNNAGNILTKIMGNSAWNSITINTNLSICNTNSISFRPKKRDSRISWNIFYMDDTAIIYVCIELPYAEISTSPDQSNAISLDIIWSFSSSCSTKLVLCYEMGFSWSSSFFGFFVGFGCHSSICLYCLWKLQGFLEWFFMVGFYRIA
ncbi:hypothetical protein MKX01_025782 [Papaver californicum]|nr:hypothetical protein MKX01_025782 [Papaver californicum]